MLCTVSLTENVPPRFTVVGGSLTAVSTRSGPLTVPCTAEALQLLLSFISGTTKASSAQARQKSVSTVFPYPTLFRSPLDVAADASEGTERLPVRRMLLALFEVVVDR